MLSKMVMAPATVTVTALIVQVWGLVQNMKNMFRRGTKHSKIIYLSLHCCFIVQIPRQEKGTQYDVDYISIPTLLLHRSNTTPREGNLIMLLDLCVQRSVFGTLSPPHSTIKRTVTFCFYGLIASFPNWSCRSAFLPFFERAFDSGSIKKWFDWEQETSISS